jgi:hypothetical protein
MKSTKKHSRPRRGRPPLAPGARRDKLIHLLMTSEERQYLVDLAKRSGRYLSEEIMRRLRASFQVEGGFEDVTRAGKSLLLNAGWVRVKDPKYGNGELLASPECVLPGPFISEEEAGGPVLPPIVTTIDVKRRMQNALRDLGLPLSALDDLQELAKKHARKKTPNEEPKEEKRKGEDAA